MPFLRYKSFACFLYATALWIGLGVSDTESDTIGRTLIQRSVNPGNPFIHNKNHIAARNALRQDVLWQ
jgi:hypothetical protein